MDLDVICYKNTPLKKVIFRIDFLDKVPELNSSLPEKITEIIKRTFPIVEPRDIVARTLQISNSDVSEKNANVKEWHFHTAERNVTLIIKEDSIGILVNNYISFQKINEVIIEIKNVFFSYFDKLSCKRIGLRYINEININEARPLEWNEYINKNLTSIFQATENPENIIRAFHNLEIKHNEIMLKFQYGIHNADYPAIIKKKIFILDLDASYTGIIRPYEIDDYLIKQHKIIQNQFEFSITQKLRETFKLVLND